MSNPSKLRETLLSAVQDGENFTEETVAKVLDAIIAELPKTMEPYRTGVDPDSMFRKGQSHGYNSALIDVMKLLTAAKQDKNV